MQTRRRSSLAAIALLAGSAGLVLLCTQIKIEAGGLLFIPMLLAVAFVCSWFAIELLDTPGSARRWTPSNRVGLLIGLFGLVAVLWRVGSTLTKLDW